MHRRFLVLTCAALLSATAIASSHAARGRAPGASRAAAGDTSRVHLGPADAGTGAFVAWPPGRSAAPAVIVVHEWWGLNAQIRDVARRFARQGYLAIVPDLYHGPVASDPEKAHELSRGVEPEIALADLEGAVRWIRSQPRTAKARIGVIGFCMGGEYSLKLALASREIAAAVMFYGRPETDPAKLATLEAPLQAHFGVADQGIPMARVEEFRAALDGTGKTAEIYTYPGAGHAFMHEGRPSYHPDAARQAWARTLAFYQRHLKE